MAESWPKVSQRLAESWPKVDWKLAEGWPKVARRLAESWPKVVRRLSESMFVLIVEIVFAVCDGHESFLKQTYVRLISIYTDLILCEYRRPTYGWRGYANYNTTQIFMCVRVWFLKNIYRQKNGGVLNKLSSADSIQVIHLSYFLSHNINI